MKKILILLSVSFAMTLALPVWGADRQAMPGEKQPVMQPTPGISVQATAETVYTCPPTIQVTLTMNTATAGVWIGTDVQRPPITASFDRIQVAHQDEMVCFYKIGEPCSLPSPIWNVYCQAAVIKRMTGYICETVSNNKFVCRKKG